MYRDKSFFPIKTLVFGFALFLISFLHGTGYELKHEKIIIPHFGKNEKSTLENNPPIEEISQIESSSNDTMMLENPEPSEENTASLDEYEEKPALFEEPEKEQEDEETMEFLNYDFKMPIW